MLPIVEGCGFEMLQITCKWEAVTLKRCKQHANERFSGKGGHHTIGPGTTNICTFVVLYIYCMYVYIYYIIISSSSSIIISIIIIYIWLHIYYIYMRVCTWARLGYKHPNDLCRLLKKSHGAMGLVKMVWVNLRTRIASSTTIMAWDSAGMTIIQWQSPGGLVV
jgi:hypothetical protein